MDRWFDLRGHYRERRRLNLLKRLCRRDAARRDGIFRSTVLDPRCFSTRGIFRPTVLDPRYFSTHGARRGTVLEPAREPRGDGTRRFVEFTVERRQLFEAVKSEAAPGERTSPKDCGFRRASLESGSSQVGRGASNAEGGAAQFGTAFRNRTGLQFQVPVPRTREIE
jgi:hypothetical protein